MRVLLVDDHLDGLEVTARLLKLEGFEVLTATHCRDAVRLGTENRCDLLVTDLGLPDGTGMDVLSDLNRIYPIPGIAITAHGEAQFVEGSRKAGFAHHIPKPFIFSELLSAIRTVNPKPLPTYPSSGGDSTDVSL